MRITFVSWRDLAHPQAGGSEQLVDRLARGCVERGHPARLLCGGPVGERAYPVHDLGGTFTQYARAPLTHARLARRDDVLVDVANGVPFFSPLWRRRPVVCLVHHIHTEQWRMTFPRPVAAFGRWLELEAVPRVYRRAGFLAVSESTAAGLVGQGVSPEQIRVVRNGVDAPEGPLPPKSPEPLFVALGRLVPHKRLDLLLRTWEEVRRDVGGRLVIAGDGPERARLTALAGADADVVGRVSEEEKHDLLARAWLLVHTAAHEGWGIVTMEAAMRGTPTLGFDVPGVRDAVVQGTTGVLASTEEELARRWRELAGDVERRAQLGAAARRRAESFSWDATMETFLDAMREAVAQRVRPRPILGCATPAGTNRNSNR